MSVRQSPPGRGGKGGRVHFTYTPTGFGQQWHAFIAGPCAWFECHTRGKTKPCLAEVTGGELVCPLCASPHPTEQVGYQPLYRELDGKPVMVVVHESVREVVDSHKLHARVLIGREMAETDGVYVIRPLKSGKPFTSTLAARQKEADVIPTLLRVWNIGALQEWAARQEGIPTGGCNTHPVPPVVKAYTPPPTSAGKGGIEDKPCAEVFGGLLRIVRERAETADDRTAMDPPRAREEE
jgi:hypothetical protein